MTMSNTPATTTNEKATYRIETTGDGAGVREVTGTWADLVNAVTPEFYSDATDEDRADVDDMLREGVDGGDGWNGNHVRLMFEDSQLTVTLVPPPAAASQGARGESARTASIEAKRAIVTDQCRTNRGNDGALAEALARIEAEAKEVVKAWPVGESARLHFVLMVEHATFASPAPVQKNGTCSRCGGRGKVPVLDPDDGYSMHGFSACPACGIEKGETIMTTDHHDATGTTTAQECYVCHQPMMCVDRDEVRTKWTCGCGYTCEVWSFPNTGTVTAPPADASQATRVNEIRERCKRSTPGRWWIEQARNTQAGHRPYLIKYPWNDVPTWIAESSNRGEQNKVDFEFICAAHNEDIPWLLDQLAAATARAERLESDGETTQSVYRALVEDFHRMKRERDAADSRLSELRAAILADVNAGRAEVDKALSEFGYDSLRFADVRHGHNFSTNKIKNFMKLGDDDKFVWNDASLPSPAADEAKGAGALTNIPTVQPIDSDHDYRLFAVRVPANEVYVEKLAIFAMPNATDACPKGVGHLTVSVDDAGGMMPGIEWIEVNPDDRRKGLGRRMWLAAENLLGRKLEHDPVTDEGEAFANAMESTLPAPPATRGEGEGKTDGVT